jgi:hypothetical protein
MSCNKNCQEINVPEVDNTSRKCTDCGFLDIECVITEEAIPYLGITPESNLQEIIEAFINVIQEQRNMIDDLQVQIDNL